MNDSDMRGQRRGQLPPLPRPPRHALSLLESDLLPASLAHPTRAVAINEWEARQGTRGPAAVATASFGAKMNRIRSGGKESRSWSSATSEDEGSEWEDEHTVGHEPIAELVVLSRHPGLVKHEVRAHVGVLVAVRQRGRDRKEELMLERMPLSTRIGMRLLYHGIDRGKLVNLKQTERMFQRWSVREGRKFDDPKHAYQRILAFVRTYNIDCSQLREPDLRQYPNMNSFFTRRLARGARPPACPRDPTIISSAADCRLTVFSSVDEARRLWIKLYKQGKRFTLLALLQDPKLAAALKGGSVAIFRLAVEDYHRFHLPIDAVVGKSQSVPGAYYTVNSMIVRDGHFDVFTENKRDITVLWSRHPLTGDTVPIAYVQVGALLVASIRRTVQEGKALQRGDDLGYFAYGGSTIICVFPASSVQWDEDLLRNSQGRNVEGVQVETLVKVGERIGRWVEPTRD